MNEWGQEGPPRVKTGREVVERRRRWTERRRDGQSVQGGVNKTVVSCERERRIQKSEEEESDRMTESKKRESVRRNKEVMMVMRQRGRGGELGFWRKRKHKSSF